MVSCHSEDEVPTDYYNILGYIVIVVYIVDVYITDRHQKYTVKNTDVERFA